MADTVNVRIDPDVAALARATADRSGLPMAVLINTIVRRALTEAPQTAPVYVPVGRSELAKDLDKQIGQTFVWVWYDRQGAITFLPASLQSVTPFTVTIQADGGVNFAVDRDRLVAWHHYTDAHTRQTHMYNWRNAGAALHPACPSGYRV